MIRTKLLSFIAFMAALANILSTPPIAIPIALGSFQSLIHFTQLPILIACILAGPAAGLVTGAIGGFFMSFAIPKIPFIVGGLAILGCSAGFFAKKFRPLFAGVLAWFIQAPYVAITDYVWFTWSLQRTPEAAWALVASTLGILTIEAIISSVLAEIIIKYLRKAHITL